MSGFLTDTNIFSKIFKGSLEMSRFVKGRDSVIDAAVYIECIQGSKSDHEKRVIEKYLRKFPLLPITPEASAVAIELIRKYSNSHGLSLPDALIAATALENDLTVITYNVSDFKFIQDLKFLRPLI